MAIRPLRRRSFSRRARLTTALTVFLSYLLTVEAVERFRAVDVLNRKRKRVSSPRFQVGIDDVQELWITQQLDHFAATQGSHHASAPLTFQQRYFYTDRYAREVKRIKPASYAFLCVGGEGPDLDKSVLVDSGHCSGDMIALARMLHAEQDAVVHLFGLEHRYYGKSYPVFTIPDTNETESPVANQNLVFLSSQQALADLAHFIKRMNEELFPSNHRGTASTETPIKWVTFGGSYPGMLAAWSRLKYPSLVHAAVSNSAPVQPQLDFAMYNNRVSYDLQYEAIGGSVECLSVVLQGHDELVQLIQQPEQHERIADMFGVCNATSLSTTENVRLFLGDGVIGIPAQSNDPSCSEAICNVDKLCKALLEEKLKSSDSVQVLAAIARLQQESINKTDCLNLDWNDTLNELASPSVSQADGMRSWLWQTCTEFGFYQTCREDSLCPFGRGYHPLSLDLEVCKYAFEVDDQTVMNSVQHSLQYYGGWNMNATRILSVNGDSDPWSALAMIHDRSLDGLPTHWVAGASHHFWTHPVKDSDGCDVQEGRLAIYAKIMQWLEETSEHGAMEQYDRDSIR